MPETPTIEDVLAVLAGGGTLSESDSEFAFGRLLAGEMDPAQIGALLAMLQVRGVTPDELTGAARVMRSKVQRVPYEPPAGTVIVDTCGTGGAPKTFNVSTAAAFVIAGATPEPGSGVSRVVVAKHGNRSRTRRGSAEVLAKLEVNIDADDHVQAECLHEAGVCFCFAIRHHPAMKHAAPVRRALGFPTAFNLLGPLTNPAGADRQLIGVYRPEFVGLVSETLRRLGATHAMVVHSDDGLDELTVTAPCTAAIIRSGEVEESRIDPAKLGFKPASVEDVRADDESHAAEMVRAVLDGDEGPATDMVLLTSAAALVVAGAAGSIEAGIELARESIRSGRAAETLRTLVRVSSR
ncbi:MAG: anthranilate phosphoribosyltransferase [Phycisphaerales bacterium]|nr:anthranilate phosphoribosyltransferase [Planctomycetota bacterium]MCH8509061.1 anthranilate phosphoribosyltransferase [Phycisphaerales bacterium]